MSYAFGCHRFKSKKNKQAVTEEYLQLRTLYRETGLTIPQRKALEKEGKLEPLLAEIRQLNKERKEREQQETGVKMKQPHT